VGLLPTGFTFLVCNLRFIKSSVFRSICPWTCKSSRNQLKTIQEGPKEHSDFFTGLVNPDHHEHIQSLTQRYFLHQVDMTNIKWNSSAKPFKLFLNYSGITSWIVRWYMHAHIMIWRGTSCWHVISFYVPLCDKSYPCAIV
jgi:hypothetical protein